MLPLPVRKFTPTTAFESTVSLRPTLTLSSVLRAPALQTYSSATKASVGHPNTADPCANARSGAAKTNNTATNNADNVDIVDNTDIVDNALGNAAVSRRAGFIATPPGDGRLKFMIAPRRSEEITAKRTE
ncbi:MAG: hypothetical protein ACR2P7_00050 [bacterium]